jgi:hypothetical protein
MEPISVIQAVSMIEFAGIVIKSRGFELSPQRNTNVNLLRRISVN